MIAGDIQHAYRAASHIMDRIDKAARGLNFYVWVDQAGRVNYSNANQTTIPPETGLVGTYVRRANIATTITASQICEDIEACKEPIA